MLPDGLIRSGCFAQCRIPVSVTLGETWRQRRRLYLAFQHHVVSVPDVVRGGWMRQVELAACVVYTAAANLIAADCRYLKKAAKSRMPGVSQCLGSERV